MSDVLPVSRLIGIAGTLSGVEVYLLIPFVSWELLPWYSANSHIHPRIFVLIRFFCIVFGIFGIFAGQGFYLIWFANPLFILSVILFRKSPEFAFIGSISATIIAAIALKGGTVLLNEAGHTAYITRLQSGYWFWISAMIGLVLAAAFQLLANRKFRKVSA